MRSENCALVSTFNQVATTTQRLVHNIYRATCILGLNHGSYIAIIMIEIISNRPCFLTFVSFVWPIPHLLERTPRPSFSPKFHLKAFLLRLQAHTLKTILLGMHNNFMHV